MSSTHFTIYTRSRTDRCPPNPPHVITALNALFPPFVRRPAILAPTLAPQAHGPTSCLLRTSPAVTSLLSSCALLRARFPHLGPDPQPFSLPKPRPSSWFPVWATRSMPPNRKN
ncbi:unnamed protein product [Linum trigynum]|uniref:Uncharacterized protein n=1 Tax=Linum trigynum TaxID=586398 RepID=A0AAV2GTT2_9ROSI